MAPLVDRRRLFDALHALSLLDAARSDTTLAELALAHRRARESGAEPARPTPIGLREFFARFHDHYREEQAATRSGVRWAAGILCRALGPAMPMEALSLADVLAAAEPIRATRTYNGFVKIVGTALRWGNREGLVDLPFADSLKRRPEPFREPVFFAPEKVERIFRVAEAAPGSHYAAAGLRLTLGFFAGVRSVEIERAVWEDLNLDEGVLRIPRPKGYTNGQRPRLVELEGNAVAWLRRWRRWTTGQRRGRDPHGPIVPRPQLFAAWKVAHLAPMGLSWGNDAPHGMPSAKPGRNAKDDREAGPPREGRSGAIENCRSGNVMRHTYATMHVGAFRNAASTALNLGHGHSTEMLERHYRGLVPKTVAQRYWTIFPS